MRDLYFSASNIQGANEETNEGRNIQCAWWGGVLIGKNQLQDLRQWEHNMTT